MIAPRGLRSALGSLGEVLGIDERAGDRRRWPGEAVGTTSHEPAPAESWGW